MTSPETKAHNSVDFKSIGQKFQSGESLNDAEKDAVMSIGLEYTRGLIESKKGFLLSYDQGSQIVKDYYAGMVLGRMIRLYKEANKTPKKGTEEPESITRFKELKSLVSDKLVIEAKKDTDEKICTFFKESTNSYLDIKFNDEVGIAMKTLREAIVRIVADNPRLGNTMKVLPLD